MIKLSIIVPVYNVYNYLEKCLDSLVKQTLKDIEIIIVNDGSTDNSQKIIDIYTKKYPKIIKSYFKKNGGLSSARNFGLQYAVGEYIAFVDSDDYVDVNFAKDMYKKAKKESAEIVVCDMIEVNETKEQKYYTYSKFNNLYETTPSVCNKIFKKTLFENIKFKEKIWYEDLNIMLKIIPITTKISTLNKGYYFYSYRQNSTTKNNNSIKNLDIITSIEDAKKYLIKTKQYDNQLFEYIVFDHILLQAINRVVAQKNKEKYKVISILTNYCKNNIKDYKNKNYYKKQDFNTKIVANLNYNKLSFISNLLFNLKKIIIRGKKND